MIKTLSPYYISIPFVAPLSGQTCTQFTLNIYIWNGLKSAVPTTPTYQVIKDNPTSSTETIKINIANWISDFIDFAPQEGTTTELLNGNNQYWVKWETFYATETPTDATTPTNINVKLYGRGYSYGLDGQNVDTPTNKILIPIVDYKVSENSIFILPIEIAQTEVAPPTFTLDSITLDDSFTYDFAYTKSFSATNYLFYKLSTDAEYTPLDIISDISGVIKADVFDLGEGTFDFVIRSYDTESAEEIQTNSEQITITYPSVILNSVTNTSGTSYEYDYTLSESADIVSLAYKQSSDSVYTAAGAGTTAAGVNTATASISLTGSVDFRVTVSFGEYITNSNVITITI